MRQKLCWGYFAFIRTRLVEVITRQVRCAETRGQGSVLVFTPHQWFSTRVSRNFSVPQVRRDSVPPKQTEFSWTKFATTVLYCCSNIDTWIIAQGSMSNAHICERFRCSKKVEKHCATLTQRRQEVAKSFPALKLTMTVVHACGTVLLQTSRSNKQVM